MLNIKQHFIPVALGLSAIGMNLSGCSSSHDQSAASQMDSTVLTDKDFAAADIALTDQDFAVADVGLTDDDFSGAKAKPIAGTAPTKQLAFVDTPDDFFIPDKSNHSNQQLVILPKTAPPVTAALTSNQQAALLQTQSPLSQQKYDPSTACAEGAQKGAKYAVAGTLLLAGVDIVFFGGTITGSALLSSVFAAGAKGAAYGCAGGAATGNPNSGATAYTPVSPVQPARP